MAPLSSQRRALAAIAILVTIAGLAALAARRARPEKPESGAPSASASTLHTQAPPPSPPAGPAELALVAPLTVGTRIQGWRVQEIRAVSGGSLPVIFAEEHGKGRVELDVALLDPAGLAPPASAGPYAVFYSTKRALDSEGDLLARRLARLIQRNVAVPQPPGLAPYQPRPREPDPL